MKSVLNIIEGLKINSKTKLVKKYNRYVKNWTIENAEDGDIVKVNNQIFFIYKCLNTNKKYLRQANEDTIIYHASYLRIKHADGYKHIIKIGPNSGVGTVGTLSYELASDKECENFINELKKQGYKWDFENKELIKIK